MIDWYSAYEQIVPSLNSVNRDNKIALCIFPGVGGLIGAILFFAMDKNHIPATIFWDVSCLIALFFGWKVWLGTQYPPYIIYGTLLAKDQTTWVNSFGQDSVSYSLIVNVVSAHDISPSGLEERDASRLGIEHMKTSRLLFQHLTEQQPLSLICSPTGEAIALVEHERIILP
jgi:hypothetical protein